MLDILKSAKGVMRRLFFKCGYDVKKVCPLDTPVSLWDTDMRFNAIFGRITGRTIVDKIRCYIVYQYAVQTSRIPGDVAELGVYKGGSAKLLAKTFEGTGKTVHLFDTFTGMPPSDKAKDTYKEGDFGDISFEEVKGFLSDCKNIRIYKGVFPMDPDPVKDRTFCMAHIDADIYDSVKAACRFFYPRIERGGIIVFDDYGFPLCPGARAAVDEFFADKKERPLYLPTGQCVVTRI